MNCSKLYENENAKNVDNRVDRNCNVDEAIVDVQLNYQNAIDELSSDEISDELFDNGHCNNNKPIDKSNRRAADEYIIYPHGYLKIVIGCMFSGKTTYIINECRKWQRLGKRALIINYALDKRYSDEDKVMSHDKIGIDCLMMENLTFDRLERSSVHTYDIVLINEGQFFPNLKDQVKYLVDDLKKIVVVSGLDGDFLRGRFGEILDLIPDCDELIKLKAYCPKCSNGTEAIFTWKTEDNPTD